MVSGTATHWSRRPVRQRGRAGRDGDSRRGGADLYAARMFDERPDIQSRLEVELVAWMTTVDPAGQPQTSPVWFLVQGESIVVYSLAQTPRTRNIAANPRVSLNLNSTREGGEVVVIEGLAEVIEGGPPAAEDLDYVAKVRDGHGGHGHDSEVLRSRLSGAHPCPADPPAGLVIEGAARFRSHGRERQPGT